MVEEADRRALACARAPDGVADANLACSGFALALPSRAFPVVRPRNEASIAPAGP